MTTFAVESTPPTIRYPHASSLTHAEAEESAAIMFGVLAAAIAGLFTLVYTFNMRDVSVIGNGNVLARLILYSALLIALTVAPYSFVKGAQWRKKHAAIAPQKDWRWRVVPVTLSAIFVNFILVLVGLGIVSRAFPGLMVSNWAAPITMGMVAAAIAYASVHVFYNLRSSGMLYVSLTVLFATLFFAGALHENSQWFVESFSHLGASDTSMSYVFNLGIIMAGVLLIVWQDFLMEDLAVLQERGLVTPQAMRIIHWGLIVVPVLLAGVGATPWGLSPLVDFVHILAAGGAGVAAGLIILAMWWLIPWFPRWFYYASWALVAMAVAVVILKLLDYAWLTGMQFAVFMMVAFWFALFMRNAWNLVRRITAPQLLSSIYEEISWQQVE